MAAGILKASCDEDSVLAVDYATLEAMQRRHPAWRLLLADSAPLVASFLHRVFVAPNVRVISQAGLVEALEDTLFALREQLGPEVVPKRAQDYLNDWASNERSWLRKFYPNDSDEPHFDLMPATEKAIGWLTSLTDRSFVGTASRLLTLFELGDFIDMRVDLIHQTSFVTALR